MLCVRALRAFDWRALGRTLGCEPSSTPQLSRMIELASQHSRLGHACTTAMPNACTLAGQVLVPAPLC
eukprot:4282024-Prymnesium_polylepis.1